VALTLVVLAAAAPARASEVSWRIEAERRLERRIVELSRSAQRRERRLHDRVLAAQRTADDRPGLNSLSILSAAHRAERRYRWRVSRRLRRLEAKRAGIESWLATWAVFRVCPVDPPRYVHDDFGQIVRVGDVEPHVHRGSDIQAPTWTPIRAPFDGYAVSSSSPLGGYQVRVHGDRGYAFIAHLIGYGRLGWVRAGTTIGYVGSTGLSTAPHAHFEWHPWDGAAVDPYYLLRLTCG
jgi:murein DD-endopeptidase MepM/ murein hydrolase activator NlpD